AGFVMSLAKKIAQVGVGRIATVVGRYYAMDRDKRWERVEKAFQALVHGDAAKASDPVAAVGQSYAKGVTDEFVEPVTITDPAGTPVGLIRAGDAALFYNFRADRGRELSVMLNDPKHALNLHYVTMTQYEKSFPYPFVVVNEPPVNVLGGVLSEAGLKNLR